MFLTSLFFVAAGWLVVGVQQGCLLFANLWPGKLINSQTRHFTNTRTRQLTNSPTHKLTNS